jgi:hypothetical protein
VTDGTLTSGSPGLGTAIPDGEVLGGMGAGALFRALGFIGGEEIDPGTLDLLASKDELATAGLVALAAEMGMGAGAGTTGGCSFTGDRLDFIDDMDPGMGGMGSGDEGLGDTADGSAAAAG